MYKPIHWLMADGVPVGYSHADLEHTVLAVDGPLSTEQRRRLEAGLVERGATVLSAWAAPGVRSLWTECRGHTGLHTTPSAEYVEVVDEEIVWTAIGWSGSVFVRLATGVRGALVRGTCEGCGRTTPRVVARGVADAPAAPRAEPVRAPVPVEVEEAELEEAELEEAELEEAEVEADAVGETAGPSFAPAPEPEPAYASAAPLANGGQPAFTRLLDGHPGVTTWQVELRTVGDEEEVLVFFSTAGPDGVVAVLTDLAEVVPATQFVVLPTEELSERLARHDDRQVVDLRR
jgi:hypothetical protein